MTKKYDGYEQYRGRIMIYKTITGKYFSKTTKVFLYVGELDKNFEAVLYDKDSFIKKHYTYTEIDFLYNKRSRDIVMIDD